MTSINSATTIKVKKKTISPSVSPKGSSNNLRGIALGKKTTGGPGGKGGGGRAKSPNPRGQSPKLQPLSLSTETQKESFRLLSKSEQHETVNRYLQNALGNRSFEEKTIKPHTSAQTSRDRGRAAADVATAAKIIGVSRILKSYGVLTELERTLIPNGIGAVFASTEKKLGTGGGMTRIVSSASLASLASQNSEGSGTTGISEATSITTGGNDKKKTTPSNAREGALLVLRALCEIVGRPYAEPYVIPMLAAVLDECGSSHSTVREAAEDTSRAIIKLSNPHAASKLVCPVLFMALKSPEWRVKYASLDRLKQLSSVAPGQISRLIPQIIPVVSSQVWDTKQQVSKAAGAALLATCQTNTNPDVRPAVPAVVSAIVKPSDTVKAIEELMGTTFVATVDASTLALLCPVLSRGLKEKLAIHKRACCLVIENMSRLVETPEAVAPFGPLLVPELKKVAENVQFEEIRDAALAALQTLTKALGHASVEDAVAAVMAAEAEAIEEERRQIEADREAERLREEEVKRKEEEERRLWKEAMDAQRMLDKMSMEAQEEKKAEENRRRDKEKKSTKSQGGKCKACGLKKCRKDCLFAT